MFHCGCVWEWYLLHLNDLKAIVNLSYMKNMVLPNGFTITALWNPSGIPYEDFKLP